MTGLPRLSVVSVTRGSAGLAAATLARVRELASEILVAVDDRVDPDSLSRLRDVADRVVPIADGEPVEANLAWLDSLATGDWMLHLEGGDVVSDALLARLATPEWDAGITHAWVSYRWCWPSPGEMLDETPWWPDPALRLLRTTPGITRYLPGARHRRDVVGDHRFLDEGVYNLDLTVESQAAREAEADRAERATPGLRTDRGLALSAFLLPEERPVRPRTERIPSADARAIEAVLSAGDAAGTPGGDIAVGARAAGDGSPEREHVVTAASRRSPAPDPDQLTIRLVDHAPVVVTAGLRATLVFGVTNRSARVLGPNDLPPTLLGALVLAAKGGVLVGQLRAPLPGPVAPGDEILVPLVVLDVLPVGEYRLEVGALQEFVGWHDAWCVVRLEVRAGRRVLLVEVGDDAPTGPILAALARAYPDVIPVVVQPRDPLPDVWPVGFVAVVALGGALEPGSAPGAAASDAGVPVLDGSGWADGGSAAVRVALAPHL